MTAIASTEPVVLLIDEIDKTDQEFEAMLLELLSDFQISIPELGRIEAKTRPVVLLTSNNTRELTEALKRRCLYLWLDYPDLEHELEIVRLHAPELDETIARKLVEIIHQVRELDLKKPPSIAESIDWARTLLLLGASDIDHDTFIADDERDRQAPHRPGHGGGPGRRRAPAGRAMPDPPRNPAKRSTAASPSTRRARSTASSWPSPRTSESEGVAIGTSEILDAFEALSHVTWTDATGLQGGARRHAGQVQRRPKRVRARVRPLLLPRRRGAGRAPRTSPSRRGTTAPNNSDINLDTLRQQIAAALRDGSDDALRDLARLAIAAFGRGEGSGVLGVDVQRIRRALGLRTEPQPDLPDDDPRHHGLPRDQLRKFEQHLQRELERNLIERTSSLPPKRPLNELERALPTGPIQDLAAVHRVVAQLKRRLATQGHEMKGHNRHAHVDFRRTMRACLQTGGVPIALKYRPKRPRRPEIFVLCDVSTSVTSASTFFLSVLHALHDAFRKLRSFVFIERISEVTEVFERERDFRAASEAISKDAGVADVSGYTDYGRVWLEFLALIEDELHPRATVIVLGDARTNGRPPRDDVFAAITAKAGRTFWLNPEPRLYWNYGDSVIAAYEQHCTAFECWRTDQLEEFVKALTRPEAT